MRTRVAMILRFFLSGSGSELHFLTDIMFSPFLASFASEETTLQQPDPTNVGFAFRANACYIAVVLSTKIESLFDLSIGGFFFFFFFFANPTDSFLHCPSFS
jgi:hypothetical protein